MMPIITHHKEYFNVDIEAKMEHLSWWVDYEILMKSEINMLFLAYELILGFGSWFFY